ncbi:DNA translocase FtsK [Oceanobacillus bengalensis]|uniref:DNA translocase FtsK n=2 Tax=Oceanobacillus bengalensis TaxID=1435466 RepID=A0A494YXE0_9BACI|nr:DNA translocase FtsK [Oceanobacillus bengalensis]RKQ14894.1 DNA translocase FtsK [Oceanobacillus bengalensis]
MLEKWINKLKTLFTDDDEVETNQLPNTARETIKRDVQARIRYEYPKEKSFRFPVIPDEPVKSSKDDRKTREPMNRKNVHQINKGPADQHKVMEEESQEKNRKIYKKTDKPFQATDVPSPIYGFQKREMDTNVEEIPAFKRKAFRESDTLHRKIEQEHNHIEEGSTYEKAASDSIEVDPGASYNEIATTTEVDSMEELEGATINLEDEISHTVEVISENNTIESEEDSSTSLGEETSPSEKRNVFPFNVIMTPSDKKAMRDKQRFAEQQQLKKQQENTIKKENNEKHASNHKNVRSSIVQAEQKDTFLPYHLLNDPVMENNDNLVWIEEQQQLLEETLKHFNVRAKVVKATQGPSVTRFEVHPEMGVKVSKIKNLSDDLKLNMAARDIRIEAPIPGKNTVGIEIPNDKARMVGLQEIFETKEFKDSTSPLTVALGLSIEGQPKVTNIQKMPHGLIAGATGSGKSVCINTMLISLLYKASHEDVKILLIDPKMVELAPYNGIPHLVAPVITDVKAATQSLKWAVNEMEDRYEKFVHEGVRNIEGYNKKILQQARTDEKMPFIVIVIDELADLMMTSPQDVEYSISRIAQKARACGIHLILATQRPSVDVITGLIKANIPTRISFSVSSQVDSRTIIDLSGAEKLLGKGDMLFVENGAGKSVRLQGPFVSDEEIERITNYARSLAEPNYLFVQEELLEQVHVDEDEDELLDEVIEFVINQNSASTSLLQRHFKIGYNRAARLIDTLENRGMISGQNGSKPRDVLISQKQEDM